MVPFFARGAAAAAIALTCLAGPSFAEGDGETFVKPVYKKHRLDWCANWGTDCGKPAADAFCASKQLGKATTYIQDPQPGTPTRVIGSGQVCDDDTCTSFKKIICSPGEIASQGGDGLPAQNGDNTDTQADNSQGAVVGAGNVAASMTADLGGKVKGELSAVAFKDNGQSRVAVFGKGQDNKLWWIAGDGKGQWYGWEPAGTNIMGPSATCANSSHGVTCNYIGAGDYIWSITYTGSSWGQHEKTDGLSKVSPAAASYLDEEGKTNVIAFVRDGLGRLVANWKNKDPQTDFWVWHGWTPTGGNISAAPACRQLGPSAASIMCAAKASDGSIAVHLLEGASYKKVKNLGGSTNSRPQLVNGTVTPGARVLVRGDDGKLWWREYLKGNWTAWKGTAIDSAKAPACAIQPGAATDWCFNIGPAGNVVATGFKEADVFK